MGYVKNLDFKMALSEKDAIDENIVRLGVEIVDELLGEREG